MRQSVGAARQEQKWGDNLLGHEINCPCQCHKFTSCDAYVPTECFMSLDSELVFPIKTTAVHGLVM